MNHPQISVVMATYNYGRFIGEAIQSVQKQTFTNWEMVIVDDGSTDQTKNLVTDWSQKDPRIRFFLSDHIGLSRSKNLCVSLSRARLVAFMDADDRWLPEKLARQFQILQTDSEIALVYTQKKLISEKGEPLPTPEVVQLNTETFGKILVQNPICYSSVMIRREIIETIGLFDTRLDLAVDYDYWLRAAPLFGIRGIEEPLVEYRTGHNNLSSRVHDRLFIVLSLMRRTLDRHGNRYRIDPEINSLAWSSTFRTLGFVMRTKKWTESIFWYLRATTQDYRIWMTLRALLATFKIRLSKLLFGSQSKVPSVREKKDSAILDKLRPSLP